MCVPHLFNIPVPFTTIVCFFLVIFNELTGICINFSPKIKSQTPFSNTTKIKYWIPCCTWLLTDCFMIYYWFSYDCLLTALWLITDVFMIVYWPFTNCYWRFMFLLTSLWFLLTVLWVGTDMLFVVLRLVLLFLLTVLFSFVFMSPPHFCFECCFCYREIIIKYYYYYYY